MCAAVTFLMSATNSLKWSALPSSLTLNEAEPEAGVATGGTSSLPVSSVKNLDPCSFSRASTAEAVASSTSISVLDVSL
jgi:hypothetical protein